MNGLKDIKMDYSSRYDELEPEKNPIVIFKVNLIIKEPKTLTGGCNNESFLTPPMGVQLAPMGAIIG